MSHVERVLIVDDHKIFVHLLGTALAGEADLEPVGVAHDTARALEMARSLRPDVVVMDVRLGDGDGVALARELTEELPDLRVIVLTGFADAALVRRAADSGACALLAKDGDFALLLEALRTARRGSFFTGVGVPEAAERGDERLVRAGLPSDGGTLLRLLAAGFTGDDIARELVLSRSEAQRRISGLVAALGVDSPADAVAEAVRRGLFRVGDA